MLTFALLRQLFLHASQRQPLVLAVENLHWSDPTSDAWLTAFAAQLGGTAILLLATYRPGYRLPWLAHSWATQVALPPLNTPDSLALVQAMPQAAPLPAHQHQAIVAQGSRESLFSGGVDLGRGGVRRPRPPPATARHHPGGAGGAPRPPPPEAKRLAQLAAVIGPEVPMPLLERVAGLAEDALQRGLAHLQDTELLYETQTLPGPGLHFQACPHP